MTRFFVEFLNAYINGEDYYYTEFVFLAFSYFSYSNIESLIYFISSHEMTVTITFMEEGNIINLIIDFDDPVEFNNFTNSDKFINNEFLLTTFVDVTFITYLLETFFINENSFYQQDFTFFEDYFLTNANGDKLYYSKGKIVKLVLKSGFLLIVKRS